MQQKKIIIFIIVLFIASSFWLFRASDKFVDLNDGKNWWALSFSEPKTENLDFAIENHSDQADFHWEVLIKDKKIQEGDEKIEKGQRKNIVVDSISETGKIMIEVTAGGGGREIYKNL